MLHCTYRNVVRTKIELVAFSDYFSCNFYVLFLLLSFSGVVLLLTPLFKYMFLHPLPSSEHAMVSSYLHSSLLSLAESMSVGKQRNRSKLILRALKNLLPLSPSSSHQSVLILSSNVQVYRIDHEELFYLNPLDAMGICLNKHKLMYSVLAPSIITTHTHPYTFLWTYGGIYVSMAG